MMTYSLLLAASYTLTRSVGDALFLSRVGNEGLALVFAASGLTTAAFASAWYMLTRRLPLLITARLTSLLFFVLTLAAWIALPLAQQSWGLLAGIYLLAEVKGSVNTINIVSTISGVLGGRASRRSWATVGLGAPLAGILVGSLLGLEANAIGLRTWLLLSAVLDAISLLPLGRNSDMFADRATVSSDTMVKSGSSSPHEPFARHVKSVTRRFKFYANWKQFRFWIAVLISTKVVALTLVTYFWKFSVNEYLGSNETALASYFGWFYALVGLLSLFTQLVITRRLLSHHRLAVPLLVMPVSLAILGLLSLAGTSLLFLVSIFSFAKSMEVWRRSVHDTTLNLLYTRIERSKRRGSIAFNSAVVKPLSEVGASLVLWLGGLMLQQSVMMTSVALWLLSTFALLRLVARTRRR